jgi:hypothetical protein
VPELALQREQGRAHLRNCRNQGGSLSEGSALELLLVETRWINRARRAHRRVKIVEARAGIEQALGDGAVEQSGIEMRKPIMSCKPFGERALAGGGGAVNSNDHAP